MYSIAQFKEELDVNHMEITFSMDDGRYFISDSMGSGGILICGPHNHERVPTSDAVLDKLLVNGKPMREMIHQIDPD